MKNWIVIGKFSCWVKIQQFRRGLRWIRNGGLFKYTLNKTVPFQKQLTRNSIVGADAKTIPHTLWHEWERELNRYSLEITTVKNLIDSIWGSIRVSKRDYTIKSHNSTFAGITWEKKVANLRGHLKSHRCDAMVVTSLTEIAYLLNLRGGDFRYVPVFRAYLIVSQHEVILYTNPGKITLQAQLLLNFDFNTKTCINERICVM